MWRLKAGNYCCIVLHLRCLRESWIRFYILTLDKKWSFPLRIYSTADLVTFTEEILTGKLNFLCSVIRVSACYYVCNLESLKPYSVNSEWLQKWVLTPAGFGFWYLLGNWCCKGKLDGNSQRLSGITKKIFFRGLMKTLKLRKRLKTCIICSCIVFTQLHI